MILDRDIYDVNPHYLLLWFYVRKVLYGPVQKIRINTL